MGLRFLGSPAEEVEDRFVDLADGRTLFLPRGRGGPVFVVPDEATRLRLWRTYTWVARAAHLAGLLLALSAFRVGHTAVALAVVAAAWGLGWLVQQFAVGGLQEANDPVALAETAPLEHTSERAAIAFIVVGVVLCGAAAWLFQTGGGRHDVVAALAFIGAMILLGGLRSLRETQQDVTRSRTPFPTDNTPIVPR